MRSGKGVVIWHDAWMDGVKIISSGVCLLRSMVTSRVEPNQLKEEKNPAIDAFLGQKTPEIRSPNLLDQHLSKGRLVAAGHALRVPTCP